MTERLYYTDGDVRAFDAHVIERVGDARHVVLDRSAFYPTSGGQPHDVGTINGIAVIDVVDDNERIVHVMAGDVPLGLAHCAVEPERRHDFTQQHTAQHLLSALAADKLKWETTSVHFGDAHCTIEFATPSISSRQIADLEKWCNAIVASANPVHVTFEDARSTNERGLRKPSDRDGELRIVTIEGIDRSACGGTHVARTSEIGAVLLVGTEKVRGNTRVSFLAGDRVIAHAHRSDESLASVAAALNCAPGDVAAIVAARQVELKEAREIAAMLEQEVAESRVRAIYQLAEPDTDGVRVLVHRDDNAPASMLRAMCQQVARLEKATLTIISNSPPTIQFATSPDSGVDAGARLKSALAAVGGRGGGSPRLAQGTAASVEKILEVLQLIR